MNDLCLFDLRFDEDDVDVEVKEEEDALEVLDAEEFDWFESNVDDLENLALFRCLSSLVISLCFATNPRDSFILMGDWLVLSLFLESTILVTLFFCLISMFLEFISNTVALAFGIEEGKKKKIGIQKFILKLILKLISK